MSQENVEIVRSLIEAFDGINVAAIDWSVEAIREALGRAYSPDVELRTLASGLGSGVGEFARAWTALVQYPEWLKPFERVSSRTSATVRLAIASSFRVGGGGRWKWRRVEIELTHPLRVAGRPDRAD